MEDVHPEPEGTRRVPRVISTATVFVHVLLFAVALPAARADILKILFDEPAAIRSLAVSATVMEIPGAEVQNVGGPDLRIAGAITGGLVTGGEVGAVGKTATDAERSFGYFAAAVGFASADVWSEFDVLTPPIPDRVGGEEVEVIEIRISGRVRQANLDLAVCGAAWSAELTGAQLGPVGPPQADYEFPSLGCLLPEDEIFRAIDDVLLISDVISTMQQVFDTAGVALGIWHDFEVRIPLYDRQVPRNVPLDMTVQLGRRVGSVLAAASVSAGEIDIDEIRVIGWAGIGPTVYLRTWHAYGEGGVSVRRQVDMEAFDIKNAQYGIEPYPEVTFTCPHDLSLPAKQDRGRIYTLDGDHWWRLEYIETDENPATRVAVPGDTCNYGPVVMDRSHHLVLGFQQGVADLVIDGLLLEPPQPRKGEQFSLSVLVRNAGDQSTLQVDRSPPLEGDFSFRIRMGDQDVTLPEARVLEPGESHTFYAFTWTCDGPLRVTVDAEDGIDEGRAGEQNNTATLDLPQCGAATPTVSPTSTPSHSPTLTPVHTATATATSPRTPAATASPTPTTLAAETPRPGATTTAYPTGAPTYTAGRSPTLPAVATPTPSPEPQSASADANCDGWVSVADVLGWMRLAASGANGCGTADVNGDGVVGPDDLRAAIAAVFLASRDRG